MLFSFLLSGCSSDIAIYDNECSAEKANIFYEDMDGDGFGDGTTAYASCAEETNPTIAGDCNDNNAMIHPQAQEICNGIDDNCDQNIDDLGTIDGYLDIDGDGYGAVEATIDACSEVESFVTQSGDCDDENNLVYPGATELCDGTDWDCDGDPYTSETQTLTCNTPNVLIYDGHGDESHRVGEADLVTFTEVLIEEGATEVLHTQEFPADINVYQKVFVFYPTRDFSPTEMEVFSNYVQSGGGLVLVGENPQWGALMIPAFNNLLSYMNIESTFLTDDYDWNCGDWFGTAVGAHPIVQDVDQVRYAATSDIGLGTSGTGLIQGMSGQWVMAVDSGVVMISDATLLMDHCEIELPEGNRQLFRNLYHQSYQTLLKPEKLCELGKEGNR